jgi:hypothetical protein
MYKWEAYTPSANAGNGTAAIGNLGPLANLPDIGTTPVLIGTVNGTEVNVTRRANMAAATAADDLVVIPAGPNYEVWWNGSASAGTPSYLAYDIPGDGTQPNSFLVRLFWAETT